MVKDGINNMETKLNVVKTSIANHTEKSKIDTVNKTEKPQASKSKNINLYSMNQTRV